jgi:hypothetical protein
MVGGFTSNVELKKKPSNYPHFNIFLVVTYGGRYQNRVRVKVMVFNVTFNNISVISWQSVLLVEEIGVSGENQNLSQVTDKPV